MMCESEPGARPKHMNSCCYYFTSLFGFGACFQSWIESLTGKCTYPHVKEVGVRVVYQQPVIIQNIVQQVIQPVQQFVPHPGY